MDTNWYGYLKAGASNENLTRKHKSFVFAFLYVTPRWYVGNVCTLGMKRNTQVTTFHWSTSKLTHVGACPPER